MNANMYVFIVLFCCLWEQCDQSLNSLSWRLPTMVDQKPTLEAEIHTSISSKLCSLEYSISVTEQETETEV